MSDSWNKSIKRNSISDESPKPIDRLNAADTSSKTDTPKVSVPARNNWKGLVDNESQSESDEEMVPESDEEGSSYYEEEESESDEFLDAQVEVIENYESGDSMDEDERREIQGLCSIHFRKELEYFSAFLIGCLIKINECYIKNEFYNRLHRFFLLFFCVCVCRK